MKATSGRFISSETETPDLDGIMERARDAFSVYSQVGGSRRAALLESIAGELETDRPRLVAAARAESHLPEARLQGELSRTISQLRMFAALIGEGSWVEATIDTPDMAPAPGRPDLRKMLMPAGPVVIFGASNFPFAFSTAGGDTASALAAGASVVIKGHPAHPETSLLVFAAMERAVRNTCMPSGTVQHVAAPGNAIGKKLVQHRLTAGVGFTGSFSGGRALMDYAAEREIPVPVFAEMSSVNPVVFYPGALAINSEAMAKQFAGSVTLGAGQFCTNPGLLLGINGREWKHFIGSLATEMTAVLPQPMLHAGIYKAYEQEWQSMLAQPGVKVLARSQKIPAGDEAGPLLATVNGKDFINSSVLKHEVFGPFTLAVDCENAAELQKALQQLSGQLTTTIMATPEDIKNYPDLVKSQYKMAGRILVNNAPTGVEVCASMVHGGPYPATSDARFTSVGTAAIKRWVRPVCMQNFFPEMLPEELQDSNPLRILRLLNNNYTRESVFAGSPAAL